MLRNFIHHTSEQQMNTSKLLKSYVCQCTVCSNLGAETEHESTRKKTVLEKRVLNATDYKIGLFL